MSMNPDQKSRVSIMGKKSTNREVSTWIVKQLADPNMTKSKLAKAMELSRVSIDKYLVLAKELAIEAEKKSIKKITELEKTHPEFLENPAIKIWKKQLDRKARGGRKFEEKDVHKYLVKFYNVCKTLDCPPQLFLHGEDMAAVLEQGRNLMTQFMQLHKDGKAKIRYSKRGGKTKTTAYSYAQVVRDFMKAHGYFYPTGEGGVMSQSIATFHGKYSDVRISEAKYKEIKEELKKEYGAESDEWLFFAFGIETYSRKMAIWTATTSYEIDDEESKKIMVVKVYESKTKQTKGGMWTKYIFDEEIQKQIIRRGKTDSKLFPNANNKWYKKIMEMLRSKYRQHGLTAHGQDIPGDPESSYFLNRPVHAFRHIGAQRLLLATNWNIAFVSSTGWKTSQELVNSYGEMPLSMKKKVLGSVTFE